VNTPTSWVTYTCVASPEGPESSERD